VRRLAVVEWANGGEHGGDYEELFRLIEDYSRGSKDSQAMALKVIGGAYIPSQEPGQLRDARRIVDDILERNGHFVPHGEGGGLHPQCVYAVLNVARYSGTEADRRWGASRLFRIMESLARKAGDGRGYARYAADAALLSASLSQLLNAAQVSQARFGSLN
jgi:hypothetical protein